MCATAVIGFILVSLNAKKTCEIYVKVLIYVFKTLHWISVLGPYS